MVCVGALTAAATGNRVVREGRDAYDLALAEDKVAGLAGHLVALVDTSLALLTKHLKPHCPRCRMRAQIRTLSGVASIHE